jgi:hypothetical protein
MVRSSIIVGFLSLIVACNSYASDSDRIAQLEKEIQEIDHRLSKLESLPSNPDKPQQPQVSAEGWKSITSWRNVTDDMNTSDVRKILGEPQRVSGGGLTIWYYQNGGTVTFLNGKVDSWDEPQR